MCIEIKVGNKIIETAEELLNFTGELIPASEYKNISMECCLCQVDVEKTLQKCGYKFKKDDFGDLAVC